MQAAFPVPEPAANPANAPITAPASLAFRYDEVAKIIRVAGTGLWTIEHVDAHFATLEPVARRIRAECGTVLSLVDLSRAPVQSVEVSTRIHDATRRIYRAGDRVALIVQSSLFKSQMKRTSWNENTAIFISAQAAKTWLCAHRTG